MANQKWFSGIKFNSLACIIFGVTACTPFESAIRAPDAVTFDSLESIRNADTNSQEGGPELPPAPAPSPLPTPPAPPTYTAVIEPHVVGQCNYGELDYTDAMFRAFNCDLNVIVTYRDAAGEHVLLKINKNNGPVAAQFSGSFTATTHSSSVDVFACVDGNGNGKCADEPLRDINELINERVYKLQRSCSDFGTVLYHNHYDLAQTNGTTDVTASSTRVGMLAQSYLRNISTDGAPTAPISNVIEIPLVQFDVANCPPASNPAPRTDGCFARDTLVKTATDTMVRIDSLRTGSLLRLADGRASRVTKVVAGPELQPLIVFETDSHHTIAVTTEHPMLTDSGIKMAKEVLIGDRLKSDTGKMMGLKSISRRPYEEDVYNVEMAGPAQSDHLIIAEGLVTGDLHLQTLLKKNENGRPSTMTKNESWFQWPNSLARALFPH